MTSPVSTGQSWQARRLVARAGEDARMLLPGALAWGLVALLLPAGPAARWAVVAALGAGAVLGLAVRRRGGTVLALACLTAGLTVGSFAAQAQARERGGLPDLAARQATVEVTGRLAAEPRIVSRVHAGEGRDLVVVRLVVLSLDEGGTARRAPGTVLVLGDSRWLGLHWRDQVRLRAVLRGAEPGDDVVAVALPRGAPVLERAAPVPLRAATSVRERLRAACQDLPADARGLVPGMSVGDTRDAPEDLDAALKETGLTHLSAVSGSNIALVVGGSGVLAAAVGLRRRWRPAVALATLGGYVLVCGPEPSVLRAGVMGAIAVLAVGSSRRRAALPALGTAIVVLLAMDPWLARSAGFSLSCVATLGLVVLARPWSERVAARLPGPARPLAAAVAVPLAAHLVCAPVLVALSGRIGLVSLLANVLAAPLVAPVTVLGLAAALVSLVSVGAASWLAWAAALPALGIAWVARRLADAPVTSLPWFRASWGPWLLALLVLAALLAGPWCASRVARRPWTAALVAVVLVAVLVPLRGGSWPPERWSVVACDVGQGDAMVVAGAEPGRAVLIDTGPPDGHVLRCLDRLGIRGLDALVLTHFHDDHAGAATQVLAAMPVGRLAVTRSDLPVEVSAPVLAAAAERGVRVDALGAGDRVDAPGSRLDMLGPRSIAPGEAGINDASLVLAVSTPTVSVLVTGDIEPPAGRAVEPAVREWVRTHGPFDALKVPHHGSRKQADGLLGATGAGIALVSVGADNDYGHPAGETLEALTRLGYSVERTDQHGDLALGPDGVTRQRR